MFFLGLSQLFELVFAGFAIGAATAISIIYYLLKKDSKCKPSS
jgi:hypothetical protein